MSHLAFSPEELSRIIAFMFTLAGMSLWEHLSPARQPKPTETNRRRANLTVFALNAVLTKVLLPTAMAAATVWRDAYGGGLLQWLAVGTHAQMLLGVALGFVMLDLLIYLQHRLFHAVPVLWRLHRVHHADLEIDFTTGLRFHPLEVVLSMVIKVIAIAIIAPPLVSVVAFEIALNVSSMFNHGNVRMTDRFERAIRAIVVTPAMHWIHHSVNPKETATNFGFFFSGWDRLFGSYSAVAIRESGSILFGLPEERVSSRVATIGSILRMPFRSS